MIVNCPKCHEQVTMPGGLGADAHVRCPLCQEDYLLGEALDRLPPPLQVLDPGSAARREPVGRADSGYLSEFAAGEYGEAQGGVALAEPETATDWQVAGDAEVESAVAAPVAPAKIRTSTRPRRPPKSAVGEIIKIVLGGVAGLTITQGVLWWGFHNDPFDLGKSLGGNSYTRFIVPKVYWPQNEASGTTPGKSTPTASAPTAQTGNGAGGGSGFGSKVDWNSVVAGQSPEKAPAAAPAGSEPLVGDLDMPAEKPVDPLAFDLGDPLKLDSPRPAKPEVDEPAVPPPPTDEPAGKPVPAGEPAATQPTVPAEPAEPAPTKATARLTAALEAVQQAGRAWSDSAMADKETRRNAAEQLYDSLARLADTLHAADADDPQLAAALAESQRQVDELSAVAATGRIIEVLCATALDNPDRKTAGLAVLGTAPAAVAMGPYFVVDVTLATKEPRVVRVLSTVEPSHEAGQKVLFLGQLVDTAENPLEGYEGEPGQVLLVRRAGLAWGPR